MKALIVDDESKSRQVLRVLLEMMSPEIDVEAEAADITGSIALISAHKPDLVFLDISLKDGDSFHLLEQLPELNFKTVFITAYDEYSVRALQFTGVPCLHKPVDPMELSAALKQLQKQSLEQAAGRVREAMTILKLRFDYLPLKQAGNHILLPVSELVYVEAMPQGALLFATGNRVFNSDKSIEAFAQLTANMGFIVGKRYCVNRKFLAAVYDDRLTLSSGKTLVLKE